MCGIFGITTKKEYNQKDIGQIVNILLRLSESRGKEAAGLAVKTSQSLDVLKLPLSASYFLKSSVYKKFSQNVLNGISQRQNQDGWTVIGHSRLATHGLEDFNYNNQPIIKGNTVCVHNGIIANDENLWQQFPQFKRDYQVDTEVFLSLLQCFFSETGSISEAVKKVFEVIEGSVSVAALFNNNHSLLLATNTGSLYVCSNKTKDTFIFVSEKYILEQFIDKVKPIDSFNKEEIEQIVPGFAFLVDVRNLNKDKFLLTGQPAQISIVSHPAVKLIDHSPKQKDFSFEISVRLKKSKLLPETKRAMDKTWKYLYSNDKLRRCTNCLLPETMTFIDFDERGVCNYCRNYEKIKIKGKGALEEVVSKYRRFDGGPDCIVPVSGGRDSSFGLHYIKKVLKMNPIAYTYDWGVLTDLGRKNQARICGKLGVEHIIISADIKTKRRYIRKNLEAWLRKPEIGMIPLFMAGDKELIHHAEWLKKKIGVELVIYSYGSGFENDFFKIGLAGVHMTSELPFQKLPLIDKMKLTAYYGYQYIRNPLYINRSLFDTIFAYYSTFVLPTDNLCLFHYIKWNERELLSTIIDEYNWERERGTSATWRIDDGTAPFYNYVYMTVTGLTEFDAFRSAQIRGGQISRKEAYEIIKEENKPRYGALEWYAQIIGFDINKAINRVNEIPKFYLQKK
jgi:asparagine synthetase B (glutamine-hydrolysing)